jgi:hypothetical protein
MILISYDASPYTVLSVLSSFSLSYAHMFFPGPFSQTPFTQDDRQDVKHDLGVAIDGVWICEWIY